MEVQYRVFQEFPNAKLSYTGVIFIDEHGKEFQEYKVVAQSGYTFPQQLLRYEINMQSVVIKNDIDILFDNNKEFAPDFDLFMKIASKYEVAVIQKPYVKYRKLKNSLTSKKIDRWWIETKETLDDIFGNQPHLSNKYPYEKKVAYGKVAYYKALYLISLNKWQEARYELYSIKNINYKYRLLYFISFSKTLWQIAHKLKT